MATKVSRVMLCVASLSPTVCNSVSPEDIYVELADKVMDSFAIAGEPGAFLVDFFPFCMSSLTDLSFEH
jgi:hypothetical protein